MDFFNEKTKTKPVSDSSRQLDYYLFLKVSLLDSESCTVKLFEARRAYHTSLLKIGRYNLVPCLDDIMTISELYLLRNKVVKYCALQCLVRRVDPFKYSKVFESLSNIDSCLRDKRRIFIENYPIVPQMYNLSITDFHYYRTSERRYAIYSVSYVDHPETPMRLLGENCFNRMYVPFEQLFSVSIVLARIFFEVRCTIGSVDFEIGSLFPPSIVKNRFASEEVINCAISEMTRKLTCIDLKLYDKRLSFIAVSYQSDRTTSDGYDSWNASDEESSVGYYDFLYSKTLNDNYFDLESFEFDRQGDVFDNKAISRSDYQKKQLSKKIEDEKNNKSQLKRYLVVRNGLPETSEQIIIVSMLALVPMLLFVFISIFVPIYWGCRTLFKYESAASFVNLMCERQYILLPVSCGIAANLVAKLSYSDYLVFLDFCVNNKKREFKKYWYVWCKRYHDRRFNAWSRFWKALKLRKYIPDSSMISMKLYERQGVLTDFEAWTFKVEFLELLHIVKSYMARDKIGVAMSLMKLLYSPKIKLFKNLWNDLDSVDADYDFDLETESMFEPISSDPAEVSRQGDIEPGPLFKKLASILGLMLSSALITNSSTLESAIKFAQGIIKEISLGTGLFNSIWDFLKMFASRVSEAWTSGDWRVLFKGSKMDWNIMARQMTGKSVENVQKQHFMFKSYDDQIKDIEDLIKQGEGFAKKDSNFGMEDKMLLRCLIERRDYIANLKTRMKNRVEPLGIFLYGTPNTGKTTIATLVTQYVAAALKYPVKDGDLYEVPLDDKHWNNLGDPLVLFFNDILGTGHDKNSSYNLPEILRRAVDITPFWTLQAFENKGQVIDPKVVLVTTNDRVLDFEKLGENWTKLERRYPVAYEVCHNNGNVSLDVRALNNFTYLPARIKHRRGKIFIERKDEAPIVSFHSFAKELKTLVTNHVMKPPRVVFEELCPLKVPQECHVGHCPDCPYSLDVERQGDIEVYEKITRFNCCNWFRINFKVLYSIIQFKVLNWMARRAMNNFVNVLSDWKVTVLAIISAIIAMYFLKTVWLTDDSLSVDRHMRNPIPLDEIDLKIPFFEKYKGAKAIPFKNGPKFAVYEPTFVNLSKGINDFTYDDLVKKVDSNTYVLWSDKKNKRIGNVLMINSSVALLNFHTYNYFLQREEMMVFKSENKKVTNTYYVPYDVEVFRPRNDDIIFIKVPPIVSCDLSRHFHDAAPRNTVGYIGGSEYPVEQVSGEIKVVSEGNESYPYLWKYSTGVVGDCGLPLVSKDATRSVLHGTILGIHGFGDKSGTIGLAIPVTGATVRKVLDKFGESFKLQPVVQDVYEQGDCPSKIQMLGVRPGEKPTVLPASYLGSQGNVRAQGKSQVRHTVFHDELVEKMVEPKVVPSLHISGQLRDGVWQSPFTHKIDSYSSTPSLITRRLLLRARLDFLFGRPICEKSEPLSLKQAINGIEGDPCVSGINLNSSMGNLRLFFKNKKDDLVNREFIEKDLAVSVQHYIESIAKGYFIINHQRWCLKDEPVTRKKENNLKFRFFMVSEIVRLLVCRMYLAPIVRYIYANKEFFEAYGAYNPASPDFDVLYNRISKRMFSIFGDISHMDTSHRNFLIHEAALIFKELAKDLGYSVFDQEVVYYLIYSAIFTVAEVHGDLFYFNEGLGSGDYMTFILNCICLSLLFRCSWFKKYSGPFRDSNDLACGGDDSTLGTDEQGFNALHVKDCFTEFGYAFTPATNKDDLPQPFDLIDDFVFLKRRPRLVYHNEVPTYIGVLELDSILKNLCFILPSKVQTLEDQMLQKIDSAVRELALHTPETFSFYTDVIKKYYPNFQIHSQEFYLSRYYESKLYDNIPRGDVDEFVVERQGDDYLVLVEHSWSWAFGFYIHYLFQLMLLLSLVMPITFVEPGNWYTQLVMGFVQCINPFVKPIIMFVIEGISGVHGIGAKVLLIVFHMLASFWPLKPYFLASVGSFFEEVYFDHTHKVWFGFIEFFTYVYFQGIFLIRFPALCMHIVTSYFPDVKVRVFIHFTFNFWVTYLMRCGHVSDLRDWDIFFASALQNREFRITNSNQSIDHLIGYPGLSESGIGCITGEPSLVYGYMTKYDVFLPAAINTKDVLLDMALSTGFDVEGQNPIGNISYGRPGADVDFQSTLNRVVYIADIDWSTSLTDNIVTSNCYDAWRNNALIETKLKGYRRFRGKPVFYFVVNGFSFNYGMLRISTEIYPGGGNDSYNDQYSATKNDDMYSASVVPHVDIDPSQNKTYCLKVPFVSCYDWYDTIYEDVIPLLTLRYNVVSQLRSATDIAAVTTKVKIYMKMEDVELAVPLSVSGSLLSLFFRQGDTELKPSGLLSSIATASEELNQAMPNQLTALLGPMSSKAAAILSKYGYANPTNIDHSDTYDLDNTVQYNQRGRSSAIRLTDDIKQGLDVTPVGAGIGSGDDMNILSIASKWGMFYNDVFSGPLQIAMSPMLGGILSTTPENKWRLTPLAHMASNFTFWTGSIEIKIEVVCSTFHRGTLGISHNPVTGGLTALEEAVTELQTVFLDLSKTNSVVFTVPYVSYFPALTIPKKPTDAMTDFTHNGSLYLYEVTPVRAMTVPSPIEINLYARAGPDMKFFRQLPPNYRFNVVRQGDADDYEEVKVEGLSIAKPLIVSYPEIYFGEHVQSIKDLCSRPMQCAQLPTASFATGWNRIAFPISFERDLIGSSPMYWNGTGFLGYRGGIRHQVVFYNCGAASNAPLDPSSAFSVLLVSPLLANTADFAVTTSALPPYQILTNGYAIQNRWKHNVFEFEFPYIARQRFVDPRTNGPSRAMLSGAFAPQLTFSVQNIATNPVVQVLTSCADDFSFHHYWCPPVVTAK